MSAFRVINLWDHTSWDEVIIGTAGVVLAIGAIAGGCVAMWKKVLRPMRDFTRKASRAWDFIERELSTNGGSTVKDKANQAAAESAETRRLVEALADDMARIKVHLRLEDHPAAAGHQERDITEG